MGFPGRVEMSVSLLHILCMRARLSGWTAATTHTQEFEGFEALAWDDGHELHFAEEADLVWREAGR